MRKQGNDTVFSLRLPAADAERLQRAARARGITVSRLAREAIAAGLGRRSSAWVSYGITSDAPLSITLVGIGLPAVHTTGGLGLPYPT